MTNALLCAAAIIGALLVPVCLVQLLYLESLRLRARETQALEYFKSSLEDALGLKLEQGALTFSLLKHFLLLIQAVLTFASLEHGYQQLHLPEQPIFRMIVESTVINWAGMLMVSHILPQWLYHKTSCRWLAPFAPLLRLLALLLKPLLAVLGFLKTLSDLGNSQEKIEDKNGSGNESIEALITAGAEEGLIEEDDRKLIQSVVEFGDKTVREVMTPRPNIVAINEDATLEELHGLFVREQYSRIPLYQGTIDHITGFVHVRDIYALRPETRALRTAKSIARRLDTVPETKPVDDLLRRMQGKGAQMVVVVDEYGQTAGIATMEDLVEEIVGEISDEHDPTRDVIEEPDGSLVVSGNLDLDRLEELLRFRPHEETESTTIGGLVQEWMGHVPKAGETVEKDGLRIEVVASDERRVSQVRLSRAPIKVENGDSKKE